MGNDIIGLALSVLGSEVSGVMLEETLKLREGISASWARHDARLECRVSSAIQATTSYKEVPIRHQSKEEKENGVKSLLDSYP